MHVLLVYCHPEPRSFTHALLETACAALEAEGCGFEVSDLYGEGFDPVAGRQDFTTVADPDYFRYQSEQALAAAQGGYAPDIQREQARVERADLMIFLFPLWWGAPPAMLKGWFDRVLSYGFAYVDGARFETGLFKGRSAMMCVSTGGTPARFSEGGAYGTIDQVLWPTQHCQLRYLGLEVIDPFVAYAAPRVGPEGRAALLAAWGDALRGQLRRLRTRAPAAGAARAIPITMTDWTSS
jgi:NAD(P)H dehydrogenase (quinone)